MLEVTDFGKGCAFAMQRCTRCNHVPFGPQLGIQVEVLQGARAQRNQGSNLHSLAQSLQTNKNKNKRQLKRGSARRKQEESHHFVCQNAPRCGAPVVPCRAHERELALLLHGDIDLVVLGFGSLPPPFVTSCNAALVQRDRVASIAIGNAVPA